MYIKKYIRDYIEKMPKEMKLPKHWRKFVNQSKEPYNLIIKHGNEYQCTNCKKVFQLDRPTGQKEFCPFCNNRYLIRNGNLKYYSFLYDIFLIDKLEDKLMIRVFEVERTYYNKSKNYFIDDVVEFARIIPDLDIHLANKRYYKYFWTEKIVHSRKTGKWRGVPNWYVASQNYKRIYLENIEEKTKGTRYQYAPIKEAIIYLKNGEINILKLLDTAKLNSFELLMKAGLYNLAVNCPEKFNNSGNFEKRFGISKEFLEFMKKCDITDKQLEVLKLVQVKDIRLINRLLKISDGYIEDLENAANYIDLIKLDNYAKEQKNFSLDIYLDYLRNMKRLDVPLTKKILLPENIREAHDESVKKVQIVGNKVINKKMKNRFKELSKNIYKDNVFFIRPAKDLKDMKDEAKQQNNCVYKNYSDKYAFGETDIYFLRDNTKPEESLVTIEVYKNKIRQKYQKNNTNVTNEQKDFIEQWEKNIIQKVA